MPPSSSSDGGAGAPDPAAAGLEEQPDSGLGALVVRLAEEFGADVKTLARVASVFGQVRDRAPDLFVPAAGALAPAFAKVESSGGADVGPVYGALREWALDAEAEPIERMRRDCLRFQSAMTRGAFRLYGGDAERCAESILAVQRFVLLQLALLASLSTRGQEGGGVVRTLPTPEYAAFMEIFRTTIEAHQREGKELALLLIQVEQVEQVDRLLGLQRGEAFMLRVTRRMREGVLRKQDQLGRVSRDQLACLLPRIAGEGVAILAANKILGALEAPIAIGDRAFGSDALIGIAMFPEHGADPQTLVRNGTLAVRAARRGGERVVPYNPAHGESEEEKMRYATRMRRALEDATLRLAFEPQLDLRSGRISGLEGLLRWNDAELGEVTEVRAIEAAEAAGVTRELSWWMFNNGLRECAGIARAGLQVPLSLKIAAGGLLQADFPDFVGRALRTWDVPPKRLVVEIHETALTGGLEPVKEALGRLKGHGLRLAIDGFGTGSSSLSNLAELPLDELRLAAAFVGDMRRAPVHQKIARSLVRLARDLGLTVTAEGVEDGATALALATLGCERIQGSYVSPALTAQEIIALEKGARGLSSVTLRPQADEKAEPGSLT
ncbi:MAG TPA: GGDEF domain-containing phosphodiesterase [Burkholderiales bacterium]|nr:GGDEF domain-containing phosphodiesterase [Burkholderiales bacterium]